MATKLRGNFADTHHHKRRKSLLVTGFFILILFALILFSFEDNPITGNVIGTTIDPETSFDLYAQLDWLDSTIEVNQEIEEIKIEVEDNSGQIFFGDNVINLSEEENTKISIKNFKGRLSFNGEQVVRLSGKADKLTVNGLPVSLVDRAFSVSLEEPLTYRSFFAEGVTIKKFETTNNGVIELDGKKIQFEAKNESIVIKNFLGDVGNGFVSNAIGVQKPKLTFEGIVGDIEIGGIFGASSL
ncbi:hypothetical protein HN604_01020 [archaeon]|jgi:hypothetical protein|nr:hypothetical protein [archaeon]MBT6182692.1 hypothetical protein [archaeon]MBT6606711.1 hypothetical protein [archaeon]MBT7251954.1 hypothetical protein [archaeon]MBT7660645.1 hypothetical protein [archaeon]